MLLAIGLIVADYRYRRFDLLDSTLSILASPVHHAADFLVDASRIIPERLTGEEALRRDNRSLREKNLKLRARLQQIVALEAENLRLRALLGSSLRIGERVLVAERMAVELAPYRRRVVIDRGVSSGVFIGQPVLDADAVIGQVIRVGPLSATVLLITDASHGLPVRIERNGLHAVAQGTGSSDRLELSHIPRNVDVRAGDLLTTSGLGGRFPPGYPVARITSVQQKPGEPFVTAIAEPAARPDQSREVLLVRTLPPVLADEDSMAQAAGEDVREAP